MAGTVIITTSLGALLFNNSRSADSKGGDGESFQICLFIIPSEEAAGWLSISIIN